MRPDWLPDKLVLNGTLPEIYETLYEYYQAEIESEEIIVEGVPVIHNNVVDRHNPPYTYGFTHLITREVSVNLRSYDQNRAEKLSWVVPLLKNYKDPNVSCFWFETPRGLTIIDSLAIWLEEMDFILILRWHDFSRTQKVVVTAHSIDSGNRNYWQRKRRKSSSRIL